MVTQPNVDPDYLLFEAARQRVLNRTRKPPAESKLFIKNDENKPNASPEKVKRKGKDSSEDEEGKCRKKAKTGDKTPENSGPPIPVSPPTKFFKPRRDNNLPFVPRLLKKPHGIEPLDSHTVEAQIRYGIRASASDSGSMDGREEKGSDAKDPMASHLAQMGVASMKEGEFSHPYEKEIGNVEPVLEIDEPQHFGTYEDTPLIMVNTKELLQEMISELSKCPEIAIDLEHHDMNSYQGFTCLIQMSSRSKDYIIDPFELFDDLVELNEITCDPKIIKVLHGADRDIKWLQRDFGVYIVNMFDTGQACRFVNLAGGYSLRNLYEMKCGFAPDKTHQTSDWRQRPLPQAMIDYARSDTHYLLYAYDRIKQDLGTEDMLMRVWQKSKELTLQRYENRQPHFEQMATKIGSKFGKGQLKTRNFASLEALLAWRDQDAREQDISPLHCCPDHVCFVLAQKLPPAHEIGMAIFPLPYPSRVRAKADVVARVLELAPLTPGACDEKISSAAASTASAAFPLEESKKRSLPHGPPCGEEFLVHAEKAAAKALAASLEALEDEGEPIKRQEQKNDVKNDEGGKSEPPRDGEKKRVESPSREKPPRKKKRRTSSRQAAGVTLLRPTIETKTDIRYSLFSQFDRPSPVKKSVALSNIFAEIEATFAKEKEENEVKEDENKECQAPVPMEEDTPQEEDTPLQSLRIQFGKKATTMSPMPQVKPAGQTEESQGKKRKKKRRGKKGQSSTTPGDTPSAPTVVSMPVPAPPPQKITIKQHATQKKGKGKGKGKKGKR